MSLLRSKSILLPCLILMVGTFTFLMGCGADTKESAQTPKSGASFVPKERTETTMQSTSNENEGMANNETTTEDTWAVKVNGEEIPVSQVKREAKILIAERTGGNPNAQVPPQMIQQFEQAAAEMIVNQKLLMAEAEKRGVGATEEEKQKAFDEMVANMGGAPGSQPWERFGLSEEQFRNSIDMMTQLEKLKEDVSAKVQDVTPEGVKAWYDENPQMFTQQEEVRASHILLATEEADTDSGIAEKKKELEAIRDKIVNGEATFEDMAKEHSDCPSSSSGGDLNFFSRGRMVKPFSDAAFAMDVDEVSGIVPTQFGYHIIKVTDKKGAGTVPFDEVKDELTKNLKNQNVNKELQGLIAGLRESANVEFNEAAGFKDRSAEMNAAQGMGQ